MNDHQIGNIVKIVEGHITRMASRDDQLAQAPLDGAADERMGSKHHDGAEDQPLRASGGIFETLQVRYRCSRVDYFRHSTGFGRAGFFFAAR